MTKASIYVRVSTGDQDTANQVLALTEWAKNRGYEVVTIYSEEESAWKTGHQRELARLLQDARKRKFAFYLILVGVPYANARDIMLELHHNITKVVQYV